MLTLLADKFVLRPSRFAIPVEHKTRHVVPTASGDIELWRHRSGPEHRLRPDVVLLKFSGTGGRAERATEHPAEFWSDLVADVWAMNPPGYGGSGGRASLQGLAELSSVVFEHVRRETGGVPIVLTGNSLGGVIALYLAANHPVDGLVLRNSPPLRELIINRFGWWNLWLGAKLIARQIPPQLDAVANAARCTAPAVLISSQRDRIVWPRLQELIIDAYAGEKRVLRLVDADHAASMTDGELALYGRLLYWLRRRIGLPAGRPVVRQ